jgi:soluble cytochrome b562
MKHRFLLLGCAVCLTGSAFATEGHEHTPLGEQMEAFNDAYKAFRKETDSAKGAAHAREAQEALLKGVSELPEMLKKMPDGPARQKAAAEYRKMMGRVFVTVCEVEEAFLAGNIDEVAKLVEALKQMKKEGHNKFMEDEEE